MWFVEAMANQIGTASVSQGIIAEFPVPTPSAGRFGLLNAPDNALWFAESVNQIGRAVPFSNAVALGAAVLPGARAAPPRVRGAPRRRLGALLPRRNFARVRAPHPLHGPIHNDCLK